MYLLSEDCLKCKKMHFTQLFLLLLFFLKVGETQYVRPPGTTTKKKVGEIKCKESSVNITFSFEG
jgi:hypothetical protein